MKTLFFEFISTSGARGKRGKQSRKIANAKNDHAMSVGINCEFIIVKIARKPCSANFNTPLLVFIIG